MGKYDDIMKHLGRLRGEDFIKWIYPDLNIEKKNISFEDREFEKITTHRRVDLLYKIKKSDGEEFCLLLEFETGSYSDFHFRLLEYFAFIWKEVKLPIKPVVVFLNSTKTIKENPSEIQCKIENELVCDFRYTKIILPEEPWKKVLEKKLIALLPLIPISQIPKDEEDEALKETIEQIQNIPEEELRGEVAGAFYLIAGFKYQKTIKQFIGEKLMEELMESSTYREIFESGEEKANKKLIIKTLKSRFKESLEPIEEKLNSIKELKKLDSLFDIALSSNSLQEFENSLNELLKQTSA